MWLVTKFISPTPSFSFISSSEYEVGMGNWIDGLENWRSPCFNLAKPKLHAGLKSCPFSLWAVLRKVSHWGYKTCVSHGCPALLVHGAARLCHDMVCDKVTNRLPRDELGAGQDSDGYGTSIPRRQGFPWWLLLPEWAVALIAAPCLSEQGTPDPQTLDGIQAVSACGDLIAFLWPQPISMLPAANSHHPVLCQHRSWMEEIVYSPRIDFFFSLTESKRGAYRVELTGPDWLEKRGKEKKFLRCGLPCKVCVSLLVRYVYEFPFNSKPALFIS